MQRRRWTNLPMSEPTNPKSGEKRKPDDIRQNKHREDKEKIKRRFFLSPKNFREARKKGWGRLTACIAGHAIQRKNPQDESQRFSKWRLPVADTILVYVPKLRFSSKYSDVLRSPHKLKFAGTPMGRRVGSIATYTKKPSS